MPEPSDTYQQSGTPSAPGPELQRLDVLVGRWRSHGHIVGDPAVPIPGTDINAWLPGGFFLVDHVDVVIGQQRVQVLELIGEYDPSTDSFTARVYDNLGNVTVMQARVDEQGGVAVHRSRRRRPRGPARRRRRRRSGAVRTDGAFRPERHDGQVGAKRRRRPLPAVDGHDLHPHAVSPSSSPQALLHKSSPGLHAPWSAAAPALRARRTMLSAR
jgi:hypothetical protein